MEGKECFIIPEEFLSQSLVYYLKVTKMVKELLAETWLFCREHLLPISLIVLPIAIPATLLAAIFQQPFAGNESHFQSQLISFLTGSLAYPIYAVAVIIYIAAVTSGEKIGTSTLWRLGIRYWLPYTILSTLLGLAVIAGFFLLIVPGIVLLIRCSFAPLDLVLNQSKPTIALKASWADTRTYSGVLLKGGLIIIIILYCPNLVLTELMKFWLGKTSTSFQVAHFALDLAYEVLGFVFTVFTFFVYARFRTEHQSSHPQTE